MERFPEDNIFHLPLLIGYYTGLRISETFGLTWDDIDLENRTLTVNKAVLKRNYGVDVRKVLGKRERRKKNLLGILEPLKQRVPTGQSSSGIPSMPP